MNYSIKEVSKKFNVSTYTLRYYERECLLPSVNRTDTGNRLYNDTDLEWIQLICCMRATGMSIAYIKNYVDLCIKGNDTIPERRQIIINQKDIIEQHIKEYRNLLKVVNKKLNRYAELATFEPQIIDFSKEK